MFLAHLGQRRSSLFLTHSVQKGDVSAYVLHEGVGKSCQKNIQAKRSTRKDVHVVVNAEHIVRFGSHGSVVTNDVKIFMAKDHPFAAYYKGENEQIVFFVVPRVGN